MSTTTTAPDGFRITRLKFVDPPFSGWARSYWRCKRHDRYAFRDYQPWSLSNPVIGRLACGCSGHPTDGEIRKVEDEQEALRGILAQHEAALAERAAAALITAGA